MAEKLDVTIGYVSQVERGITKISLDLLAAIATILECDIAGLVTGTQTGDEKYLAEEFCKTFMSLTKKERAVVNEIMRVLVKNR